MNVGRAAKRVRRLVTSSRLKGSFAPSLHARGLIIWAAALATGMTCIWEHVHSTELASQIERLQNERENVLAEIGFLNMECAELGSRERIEEEAGERLGMRYPVEGEVVWLRPDGCRVWKKSDFVEAGSNDRQGG